MLQFDNIISTALWQYFSAFTDFTQGITYTRAIYSLFILT